MGTSDARVHSQRATALRMFTGGVLALTILGLTACATVTVGTPSGTPSGESLESASTSATAKPEAITTIAVIGDFGSGTDDERAVADLVISLAPSAVVTVGDNVYSDAGYESLVGDYYRPFVNAQTFFPATGNHDYSQGIANFDAYFSYLNGQRTYRVSRGPIDFFVLDGDAAISSDTRNATMEWLRMQAGESTAPFKVVAVHYPPFSSGDQHGSSPDMQWDFAGMGINLVIAGHDHIYERIETDGVTYVVNGSGGKGLYACSSPRVAGSIVCDDSHFGALLLSASDSQLTARMIATDGTVIDEFVAPARR